MKIVSFYVDGLVQICLEQPFDTEKIECFIKNNNMNSEDVTRAALKLCEYGSFSYGEYLYEHGTEPKSGELCTFGWDRLFNVLISNGLDAESVICVDGRGCENVLSSLQYLDDGDLGARILRNILSAGASPNTVIDGTPFFEDVDINFIMDVEMGLYPHKWQRDNAFRFWLVLVGFGGVIKGAKLPVTMCGNRSPDIFREFERFDHDVIYYGNDFELRIIEKESMDIVAKV